MGSGDGGSGLFWGVVVATTIAIGFGVSILAGYLIGHFTGHETTVTAVVTAAQRPTDSSPETAVDTAGTPVSIRPSPAFTRAALAALPRSGWITNGGSTYNQRYSPLTQIDDRNVERLRGVWEARLDRSGIAAKYSGEATPLVHDGVIYTVTGNDDVFANSVEDGRQLWKYESGIAQEIDTICCGWTSRGVAIGDGQVYVGQLDGNLVALDQTTGSVNWETQIGDWRDGETITSAPLYYDGRVYSGLSGGEYGIRGRLTAVDAKTGRYRWHFQQVRHDIWDYDSPSPVVLWDVEIDGREVKGLSQPSKTGWLYMLDRETGRPIHGITDRPVPQDKEAQATADTQPFPDTPPFAPHEANEGERQIIQGIYNAQNRGRRRQRVQLAREMFEPFTNVPKVIKPGPSGAANWPPSSFNRTTNMIYICGADTFAGFLTEGPTRPEPGRQYLSSTFTLQGFGTYPGLLVAQDVTTGEIAWTRRFEGRNDACYSGTTSTAGNLVFVGRNDGELQAFNASTGQQLWRFQTGAGANSTPAIFEHRGRQMIAFYAAGNSLAGSPHGDSLWLFSLDGRLGPVAPGAAARPLQHAGEAGPSEAEGTEKSQREVTETPAAVDGRQIYLDSCSTCHGADATGGNGGPDLTTIPSAADLQAVERQVENGGGGMPAFRDQLDEAQIRAVSEYVVRLAR
ncbi:PQQ-binding-like beta-propeller repeat protein [Conexibacter arvalis]|uniref:Glucose dehydrogenase/cytochrome c5 n=1 Tax=Conexibacter arvalis TaxID=912552 RepID=A0A840IIM1_9ACTN|nr:PQQ-binding-like beta-propeller repeat protein [Conexibacter arvalis]MBB4664927.1 glucose dehydrogenase/cytochrome c5 [Conexibacter arvalis]